MKDPLLGHQETAWDSAAAGAAHLADPGPVRHQPGHRGPEGGGESLEGVISEHL